MPSLDNQKIGDLTKTQSEVLKMVAQGYTNSEIASRRETSVSAVEQLLNAIFRGLGITNSQQINPRAEAMRLYIAEAGLPQRD